MGLPWLVGRHKGLNLSNYRKIKIFAVKIDSVTKPYTNILNLSLSLENFTTKKSRLEISYNYNTVTILVSSILIKTWKPHLMIPTVIRLFKLSISKHVEKRRFAFLKRKQASAVGLQAFFSKLSRLFIIRTP